MIFSADDYMFKDMVDLSAISATAKVSDVTLSVDAPFVSSYGDGGAIKSSFHPFNGGFLHMVCKVLNTLPASTDDGNVSIALYTNQWDGTNSTMGTTCDKLVATYGPITASQVIFDEGVALDTILPENLGSKIQLKVTGTAFDKVSSEAPMLEVMIEEYSTTHGRR